MPTRTFSPVAVAVLLASFMAVIGGSLWFRSGILLMNACSSFGVAATDTLVLSPETFSASAVRGGEIRYCGTMYDIRSCHATANRIVLVVVLDAFETILLDSLRQAFDAAHHGAAGSVSAVLYAPEYAGLPNTPLPAVVFVSMIRPPRLLADGRTGSCMDTPPPEA